MGVVPYFAPIKPLISLIRKEIEKQAIVPIRNLPTGRLAQDWARREGGRYAVRRSTGLAAMQGPEEDQRRGWAGVILIIATAPA